MLKKKRSHNCGISIYVFVSMERQEYRHIIFFFSPSSLPLTGNATEHFGTHILSSYSVSHFLN